jgi:diacylglycerol kinase family enzyme
LVARTLGVPFGTRSAVAALLGGDAVRVDLGEIAAAGGGAGRLFAFAAGVGVDARMIAGTSARWKRRVGWLAYAATATRAVVRPRRFLARVTVDGEQLVGEATAVVVANFGAVLGGLFHFGPGVREDDGRLDVCVFRPASFAESAAAFLRLVRRDWRPHPALVYRAGRVIRVETDPHEPVQADGELLGWTPFAVEVRPGAARLLVPRGRT